jgi:hypothetical protein
MVPAKAFLSCGSDRRPAGPRPAASGQAGLGRAANARRAIERGPRPFREEPPKGRPISKHPRSARQTLLRGDANHVGSHRARHRQGHGPRVGLRPRLDSVSARRSANTARSGRRNGLQIEQKNCRGMLVGASHSPQWPERFSGPGRLHIFGLAHVRSCSVRALLLDVRHAARSDSKRLKASSWSGVSLLRS